MTPECSEMDLYAYIYITFQCVRRIVDDIHSDPDLWIQRRVLNMWVAPLESCWITSAANNPTGGSWSMHVNGEPWNKMIESSLLTIKY